MKALEECLDPDVVLEMKLKSVRIIGPAAWYDYDYSIRLPAGRIEGRGTGVCRRQGDRWLLLNMHNSRVDAADPTAPPSRQ